MTRKSARVRFASAVLAGFSPLERREVLADLEDLRRLHRRAHGVVRAELYYWWQISVYAVRPAGRTPGTGGGVMGAWDQEIRQGIRRLRRAPVFALVSVLTIGVGIGAFASVFSVVDAVLLEEPGYEDPDELVWVWRKYWFGLDRGWLAGPDISGLRDHSEVFEGVVGLRAGQANLTGRDGTAPRRVATILATSEFFDLLGVAPALGRGFRPEDDVPGAPGVAVLGHDLWESQFGSDPGIVGEEIYLNGESVRVVGVAPEDFHFVRHSSLGDPTPGDLYRPLRVDLASEDPGQGAYAGLARVKPDVPAARRQAAVSAVARVTDDLWGNPGLEMWSVPLKQDLVSGVRPALLALLASAGFLLLILVANLATLLLGRSKVRDRELAVRAALGAGRLRLLQSVVSESLILAATGATLGMGLSMLGIDLIRTLAPEGLPRLWAVEIDGSVVAVALAATVGMALTAGAAPWLQGLRSKVAARLRDGSLRAGAGLRASRTRGALVVTQVALSLVLLGGAALVGRAFVGLLDADPGFDAERVLTFVVPLDPSRYLEAEHVLDFDTRFREELTSVSGVTAAGATNSLPLTADSNQRPVTFPGAPGNSGAEDEDSPLIDEFRIGVGYAEAVGLRLDQGRFFSDTDGPESTPVALIDDLLADRFYPEFGPVGHTAVLGSDTVTIVGVVDHARQYQVHADDRPQVYRPLSQRPALSLSYAVRGAPDPALVVRTAREALRTIDPALPMGKPRSVAAIVAQSLGRERLSLTLMSAFALGALVLASLGIYGVVTNSVVRRTHEIGVRMALGADRSRVIGMVIRRGLGLAAIGVALGLVGAFAAAGVLSSVVVGAGRPQPLVLIGVATGLLAVTGIASWLPARRATRIEPVEALRPE